jgi:hypothetical protein
MNNLIINVNELQSELVRLIDRANKQGIPFAIINPIIDGVAMQVQNAARAELEQVKVAMAQQMNAGSEGVEDVES